MDTRALAADHDLVALSPEIADVKRHPVSGIGRSVLVVGDKFREFSLGKAAITLSQLRAMLDFPAELILCEPMRFIPGQGLSDQDVADILVQAAGTAHRERLDFSLWHSMPTRAASALSHKYRIENTLVSAPRQIGEDLYELDLLIDENCELMGDHQTGQHLQGMLLVEAARQAFLAITEAYFLPQGDAEFYFIFNTLIAEYKRFIFPIATRLRCCVREKDLSGNNRRFVMEALVEQTDSEAAKISCSFMVAKYRSICKMEQSLARETVTKHLAVIGAADPRGATHGAHGR